MNNNDSIKEMEELWENEEEEDNELKKIRKSGMKTKVTLERYNDTFDPTFCRYCMNYDDDTDGCKAGISQKEWEKMDRNGKECEKYDYIFECDE